MYLAALLILAAVALTLYLLVMIDHRQAAEMRAARVRLDRMLARRDPWADADERHARHLRKRAAAQAAMSAACKAMNAVRQDERRDPGLVGHVYGACYGRK